MRVEVYKNLRKNCWSIRDLSTGRVVAHQTAVTISDARFVVRPSGRARVLAEKQKNVHAFVRGEWVSGSDMTLFDFTTDPNGKTLMRRVSYNPYKYPYFYNVGTEEAVRSSSLVHLGHDGRVQARLG